MIGYGRHVVDAADIDAVVAALRSDRITQGPRVEQFESALAEYCGSAHAVVVSSGTAALHLGLLALGLAPSYVEGSTLEPGSAPEVITTPIGFVGVANAIVHCGGLPRFVDIEPVSANLDPLELEDALVATPASTGARGVVPVDLAGHPCDIASLARLARRHGLFVLRDACHALGARWLAQDRTWHRVGDCGESDATVFSFHPVKHITTAEGGALLTNDAKLAECCRVLRENGISRGVDPREPWRYEVRAPGFNYRMSELHAALGLSQLAKLDGWLQERRERAALYDRLFADVAEVEIPAVAAGVEHAYHLYVIRVRDRASVFDALRAADIGAQVHYVPVHTQPYFRKRLGAVSLPHAERYYERALSIPLYPDLAERELRRVAEVVKSTVRGAAVG